MVCITVDNAQKANILMNVLTNWQLIEYRNDKMIDVMTNVLHCVKNEHFNGRYAAY